MQVVSPLQVMWGVQPRSAWLSVRWPLTGTDPG